MIKNYALKLPQVVYGGEDATEQLVSVIEKAGAKNIPGLIFMYGGFGILLFPTARRRARPSRSASFSTSRTS